MGQKIYARKKSAGTHSNQRATLARSACMTPQLFDNNHNDFTCRITLSRSSKSSLGLSDALLIINSWIRRVLPDCLHVARKRCAALVTTPIYLEAWLGANPRKARRPISGRQGQIWRLPLNKRYHHCQSPNAGVRTTTKSTRITTHLTKLEGHKRNSSATSTRKQ